MKYSINLVTNQNLSCKQILLATYATNLKRDYEMIFAESWGFGYERDDYPFGNSLNSGYQNRGDQLLEKYHGIHLEYRQYMNKSGLLEEMESLLAISPIVLFCDVYNCPWNISYMRNHIGHYILVSGIEKATKKLYILDPYSTMDEHTIDIDKVAPNEGHLFYFTTVEEQNYLQDDYRYEICKTLDYIKNSCFFEELESFINDFEVRFEEVINSEYKDIYAIPLIINLRHIANQRYCYCMYLKSMVRKNVLDSSVVSQMEGIAEKYMFLRMLLIKQIVKKNGNNKYLDFLREIRNKEYEMYEMMRMFVRK